MKVNQFEEISAIKELDDEVAAICSGGVRYPGGNDPDVILFSDSSYRGRTLGLNASIGDGFSNLRDTDLNFNDVTSSITIIRGVWAFYRDAGYNNYEGTLTRGQYTVGGNFGTLTNDSISSLVRIG
ncbi:beta/gamma crystallin-related protein [Scytonema sp. NUACC26]|uniref:beta/gamma crystallin-related protein n=1 Tax=Scytonema sp. NUACC26 TaxID=3140176 RepID=UPI0034DB9F85